MKIHCISSDLASLFMCMNKETDAKEIKYCYIEIQKCPERTLSSSDGPRAIAKVTKVVYMTTGDKKSLTMLIPI